MGKKNQNPGLEAHSHLSSLSIERQESEANLSYKARPTPILNNKWQEAIWGREAGAVISPQVQQGLGS